ncbi:hypothetical protein [Acinetobacter rudis]|uniref:Uncharacterized protein n=1 Tax=Acinetobacter rudis TaxID=632955 RepID=A0AAW8JDV1_9GAMM|nr:hypothetical protein [Acinetobacter rudis]MDQ8937271.1 hypothetical protein [Acinetobacter rudis]MDQ8952424.1 hypothetical protein [Acinetobacter rudis]MDQ9019477.1 hypothetical protein [Acinetobacter rudis]
MDICIGGPWNGCKILRGSSQYRSRFTVRDEITGNLVKYKKSKIQLGSKNYTFWISSNLTDDEVDNILRKLYSSYKRA